MSDIVTDLLTRFIFVKRYYSQFDGSIEPSAFLPRNGETSLANIAGLSQPEIWEYADRKVALKGNISARADVIAKDILSAKLTLHSDKPPSIHVNIKGWPSSESEALLKAAEIAQRASLVIR